MSDGINVYSGLSQLLAMLPADSQQIADATGAKVLTVRKWLRQLRAGGVVTFGHKAGNHGARLVHLLPSKPYAPGGKERQAATVARFIEAWNAMVARHTTATLAAELDVVSRTACTIVKHMREHGLLRIAAWQVNGKTVTPVYDRLSGSDAPRPERKDRSEVNAVYWAKYRAAGSEARA